MQRVILISYHTVKSRNSSQTMGGYPRPPSVGAAPGQVRDGAPVALRQRLRAGPAAVAAAGGGGGPRRQGGGPVVPLPGLPLPGGRPGQPCRRQWLRARPGSGVFLLSWTPSPG